ncbi:hypothetical protein LF1_19810 [Rubripirellula obstinata]|uniref:Uncharacterized protein n=1 Tax=Rubripirellula obstinata TaxID=406547 RepID=A0A5B1CIC6_9BACT|nr:hypothetical protein LF1_19810 [Rubripirellula obstinata]
MILSIVRSDYGGTFPCLPSRANKPTFSVSTIWNGRPQYWNRVRFDTPNLNNPVFPYEFPKIRYASSAN